MLMKQAHTKHEWAIIHFITNPQYLHMYNQIFILYQIVIYIHSSTLILRLSTKKNADILTLIQPFPYLESLHIRHSADGLFHHIDESQSHFEVCKYVAEDCIFHRSLNYMNCNEKRNFFHNDGKEKLCLKLHGKHLSLSFYLFYHGGIFVE